jgi:hypothetical protein
MVVEVDVQPFTSRSTGFTCCDSNKLGSDAPMTCCHSDHRVLQPSMHEAVPKHVDEADDPCVLFCYHPPEAMAVHLLHPVPLGLVEDAGLERLGVKLSSVLVKSPRQR